MNPENLTLNPSFSYLKVLIVFFFLLGLIILLAYFIKRLNILKVIRPASDGQLKVIQVVALGEKRQLIVVRWKEQELLLGVCPQNISLLQRREADFEKILNKAGAGKNEE